MIVTLAHLGGQRFQLIPANPPLPVWVKDMPGQRSSAHAAHTGAAEVVAFLSPLMPEGRILAHVRLPSGALRHVDADAICPPTNVAPIRLGPGIHGASTARAAADA